VVGEGVSLVEGGEVAHGVVDFSMEGSVLIVGYSTEKFSTHIRIFDTLVISIHISCKDMC